MLSLYSLVEPAPPGFHFVTSYERRLFRSHPFALLAPTLSDAQSFLAAEQASLRGVIVTFEPRPTQLTPLSHGLHHLQLDRASHPILREIVEPLLLLQGHHTEADDLVSAASLEIERVRQNRKLMADEFETVRQNLLRELSERRDAEKRLRESGRKIRALLDSAFELVGLLTPDGRVIEANRTSLEFQGRAMSEVAGHPFWETPFWSHSAELQEKVKAAVSRGAAGEETRFEATVLDGKGQPHMVDFSLKPCLDDKGDVEFLVPEGWDITELKKAERDREQLQAQLMQTQKLESIGRLAGGVAHDFNNMLAVILGRAELALVGLPATSPLRADLIEIRETAERSANLTRQLLAFARRQTLAPRVLDLNEAVGRILSMLRRLVGEEVTLSWQPASALWKVKVDPSQLDQLLANLVVNARDALRGSGTITLSTCNATLRRSFMEGLPSAASGDYVILSVKDTGEGMAPEVRDHIFEPFFTTKALGRGTGLGLSTVLGIVEQHHGFIEVHSELGEGTEFVIHLPRIDEQLTSVSSGQMKRPPVGGKETILIVEDEPVVLQLQEQLLLRLGYQVLTAVTPAAALELLAQRQAPIDLLLTDVILPGMNGRDLAARLRKLQPNLRCLFMSGYSSDGTEGLDGFGPLAAFIQKPFGVSQIAEKLRELLDAPPDPLAQKPNGRV